MENDASASDLQLQLSAILEEAQSAHQKKHTAVEVLRVRRREYDLINRRGHDRKIRRARANLGAAETALIAAEREVKRLDDLAEEIVQAQLRAAYT